MPKPHPIELRERVVSHVEKGHTHRATAIHFNVSIKFVNDMVKLKREAGHLENRYTLRREYQCKLAPYSDWLMARIEKNSDITLPELSLELEKKHGLTVHSTTVGRYLHRLGLTHKKRQFLQKNNVAKM